MAHELTHRIYDFLKEFPPFNFLSKDEILHIASQSTVKYLQKEDTLFSIGDMPPSRFYIVKEGAIHLFQSDGELVETCDEGDVFGIRPLLAHSPYLLTAKAGEESLLYAITTKDFLPLIEKYPKISLFLATNFAVGVGNKYYHKTQQTSINISENVLTEVVSIDSRIKPVTVDPAITIQEAAQIMVKKGVGSVIICDPDEKPIGIITDKDLRSKVVAGDIRKKENVTRIMTSPVKCAPPNQSYTQLQMMMLKNRISHVVITEDGSMESKIMGVVSEHDLVVQQTDSPAILLKEILKAENEKQLCSIRSKIEKLIEKWLEQEVSIHFVSQVVSTLNDEIIKRVLFLSEESLGRETYRKMDYCWLTLGSEGREEQLLKTDQDNAIIYANNPDIPNQKELLLTLAKEANRMLFEIGFEYCPAEMMASNPLWCQSVDEWHQTFEKWIFQPGEKEIMMCTIFFDFRPVYGNSMLANSLSHYIFDLLDKQKVFLHFLAKNALQNPPPLSFFRNVIVEKNGEHKDSFDIKLRAMMPLVDAARLMILEKKLSGINNTGERYQALAKLDPANADVLYLAADAYEILIRIRTLFGLRHKNSGRYIQPEEMDKMAKLLLRNAFQPIDDIQKIIKIRFQV
jgi:CBS domain-containing protein